MLQVIPCFIIYFVSDRSLLQRALGFSVQSQQDTLPRATLLSKFGDLWLQENKIGSPHTSGWRLYLINISADYYSLKSK